MNYYHRGNIPRPGPYIVYSRSNRDAHIFTRNSYSIYIDPRMVILPKGGLIPEGKYIIKEMKIQKSIEGESEVALRNIWCHTPGHDWDSLGEGLLLGHLPEKSFYVTKVRIVKWFAHKA